MPARQMLLGFGKAVNQVTTYVSDTFTGIINTLLEDHTPDIAPGGWVWIPYRDGAAGAAPTYKLDGAGKVNPIDAGDGTLAGYIGDSGISDNYVLSIEGTGNGINLFWPGLIFRSIDNSPQGTDRFLALWFAESDTMALYAPDGTTLDSDALALDNSDSFRITATVSGTSISVLFENLTDVTSVTLTATSAQNQTDTYVGFGSRTAFGAGAQDIFDDFLMESL